MSAFLLLFVVPPEASAKNHDPRITQVFVVDQSDPKTIMIIGSNLPQGRHAPRVTLGDFGELDIVGEPSGTLLEAELPDMIPAGDYLLTVFADRKDGHESDGDDDSDDDDESDDDDSDSDSDSDKGGNSKKHRFVEYHLTIADAAQGPQGETGPEGARGEIGPVGPQGIQGVQGMTGADGADGVDGNDGLPGDAGADGQDGAPGQSVISVSVPVGDANCPFGGTEFASISGVTYACDGASGADGAEGPRGPSGALIEGCAEGAVAKYDGENWVCGPDPMTGKILQAICNLGSASELCPSQCGNNLLEFGEDCDDGNTISADGCSATCREEPPSGCPCETQWTQPFGLTPILAEYACSDATTDFGNGKSRRTVTASNERGITSIISRTFGDYRNSSGETDFCGYQLGNGPGIPVTLLRLETGDGLTADNEAVEACKALLVVYGCTFN